VLGGSLVSYTTVDCIPDRGGRSQGDEGNPHPLLPGYQEEGMMMLAGCAGLGEHGRRKKTNRNEHHRRAQENTYNYNYFISLLAHSGERIELGHRQAVASE
jgi:hypothetical protein